MQFLKKERHALENAASKLLSLAMQAGASTAEVCATYGSQTKIGLEKQDFHMASSDEKPRSSSRSSMMVAGGRR